MKMESNLFYEVKGFEAMKSAVIVSSAGDEKSGSSAKKMVNYDVSYLGVQFPNLVFKRFLRLTLDHIY